jgi:HK97 family phage portal protein
MSIIKTVRSSVANWLMPTEKSLVAAEGSHRGQAYGFSEFNRPWGIEPIGDGWQRGLRPGSQYQNSTAYACVQAIARTMSQCYPKHVDNSSGAYTEITSSAAYRVLRNPNHYQTTPAFIWNMVATALTEGEAFAIATRNARQEIDSLHPLPKGTCSPMIDDVTREIFYAVGSSPLAPGGTNFIAPARDVLHLRYHTPRHVLIGESPVKAAALAVGIDAALTESQLAFFQNMSRPSGVLVTDQTLNAEQMASLRAAFENQAQGMRQGRIPVLTHGLKFAPLSISSIDAELISSQRMSKEQICAVYGVPPPLAGDLSNATLNNAETLIQHFLAISLGAYLEATERALDRLFGLNGSEYIELDVSALIRTDYAGRIEALAKGVQGGLYTVNEARSREGLGPIAGGNAAFLQAQMVPVSKLEQMMESQIAVNEAEADAKAPPASPESKAFDGTNVKSILSARRRKA